MGENGIIDRTKEASFKSKLSEVEEKVILYWSNKEQEAILNGTNPTVYEKLPLILIGENETTVDKDELAAIPTLIQEIENVSGLSLENVNLYEIDKSLISINLPHTYLIDVDTLQVYDKQGEKFKGKFFHTLNSLGIEGFSEESVAKKGETGPEVFKIDGDGWLKPDMTGFGLNYTKMVYYNENDFTDILEVPLQEYIDGERKSRFEKNGKTYVLDGYNQQMWANVKTIANGLECWWIWQPRYAYHVNSSSAEPAIDVVFIDMNNNPIGDKYNGKYTVNIDGTITITADSEDSFSSGTYIVHPGFGNLQGIWMSKYQPNATPNANHTMDSGECYPPDMSGFDPQNTYIELYDSATDSFTDEVKLADANLKTINNDKRWYDYKNKIWANIKTTANGVECWWVWQPRYAYVLANGEKETEVIFVDVNNKPYDKENYGDEKIDNVSVHPGFTVTGANGRTKQLKGIWMSKYEPSNTNNADTTASSGECLEPDFTGFIDQDNTKIVYWNSDFSKTREVSLRQYISDGKQRTITYESEQYTFYDYKNKIWANIKTTANNLECWWVWQPRYAYNVSNGGKEVDVVFIGLDNKPVDKMTYGDKTATEMGMSVHPGFTITDSNGQTKELNGIWMSKYEPSET